MVAHYTSNHSYTKASLRKKKNQVPSDVGLGIIDVTSVTFNHLSNANNDTRSKDVKGSGEVLTRNW